MILYKYCSLAGLKILENQSIKVTPPNEFNDPFEFETDCIGSISTKHIKNLITDEDSIQERFNIVKKENPALQYDEYKTSQFNLANNPKKLKDEILQTTKVYQEWASNFVHQVSHSAGIACFTKDKANILMWSHYAQNHEGFMIGFEIRSFPEVKPFRVNYCSANPVQINLKYIHKTSYILRKYKEILKRKATIWEYENEYRLQFHYSVCTYRKEIDMWFFHFHHEIIREVYLGIKCKAELKSKILSLLAAQEYRHVKVYQASKSAGYQIKYIRIK